MRGEGVEVGVAASDGVDQTERLEDAADLRAYRAAMAMAMAMDDGLRVPIDDLRAED